MRVLIALSLLALALVGCAARGVASLPLYVSGHGEGATKDAALNDAYRDVIQRSAGVLMNSQMVMVNGVITQDLVQEYSGGYITAYEVLRQGRTSAGLYSVDIAANVSSTKLAARMTELGKKGTAAQPQSDQIYAQVTTLLKSRRQGDAFLGNLLSEYPNVALKASVGSPTPRIAGNRNVILDIPVDISWSQNYFRALHQTVSFLAVDSCTVLNDKAPMCNYQIAFRKPNAMLVGVAQGFRLVDDVQAAIVYDKLKPQTVLVMNFYTDGDVLHARHCLAYDLRTVQTNVREWKPNPNAPPARLMNTARGVELVDDTYKTIIPFDFNTLEDIKAIKRIDAELMGSCPSNAKW